MPLRIILILCSLFSSGLLWGEDEKEILLPFIAIGLDGEETAKAAALFRIVKEDFVKLQTDTWQTPKNVKPPLINLRSFFDEIKLKNSAKRTYVQMGICSLMGERMIFAERIDAKHSLINITHTLVDAKAGDNLVQHFTKVYEEINSDENIAKDSNLQIELSRGFKLDRNDMGSDICLNLILAESLLKAGFQILPVTGSENIAKAERFYPNATKKSRPTRSVLLKWLAPQKQKAIFPLELTLVVSHLSGVFADPILQDQALKPVIEKEGAKLRAEVDARLMRLLSEEKAALLKDSPPKIAKIHRAWIYLDKGRGWGLKLSDRLVISENPNAIKGHVVAFFGPEAGVKREDGTLVNEGAIVYIRKGQRLTKVGQSLQYDTRTFPTPWPMKAK